ncbi:hypothetical protein N7456_010301 [Penicillium angulare]|uniref:Gluconate transport inducer 1/Pac2 n=1 Tax=Penicillium angulare TaxID=116970 RepID=A0A9W9K6D1_9EURO|nr:hypothetical protein N7456_010301 [Penicillium angulare]
METYYGHVRTPADAIILFEACRMGLLPRVQRRLSEKERQSIRSGSVFVWDEREAGMRRWTDGKSWSASRVSGSFLTYREMEGKRGGGSVSQSSVPRSGKTPESRGSDDDRGDGTDEGPDGYRYKPDGLMKQSFSITTSTGQHLHLISYYARAHSSALALQQPTTDQALRHVRPQKGLYPESTVNDQQNLPVVTRGPMAGAAYPITPHPHPPMGAYPPRTTHAPSYAPSYTWGPPTPLPTPPSVSVHYGPGYIPAVSGPNGAPQYGQPPHQPPPHTHHHGLPPPPPHGVPMYERPHHESVHTAGPPPAGPPGYPGRSPQMREHMERGSPRGHGQPMSDPRLASPRVVSASGIPQQNGITKSPHMLKQTPPSVHQLVPIGTPPKPSEQGPPGAVPGIGSLMASASLAPISAAGHPAGSGSPGAGTPRPGAPGEGPRDIPNEKIGFVGEDMRALRQLDRVFTA